MEALTTAMVAAATSVATDGLSVITSIVPVALPVMAAFIVVRIGIRAIKAFTGRG